MRMSISTDEDMRVGFGYDKEYHTLQSYSCFNVTLSNQKSFTL